MTTTNFPEAIDRSAGPEACWPWTGALDNRGYACRNGHPWVGKGRCPTCNREAQTRWRAAHPELHRQRTEAWRKAHLPEVRERQRRCREAKRGRI